MGTIKKDAAGLQPRRAKITYTEAWPERSSTQRPRRIFSVNTASGRRQGVILRGPLGWLAFFHSVGGLIMTGGFYRTRTAAMTAVRRTAVQRPGDPSTTAAQFGRYSNVQRHA